MTRERTIRSVVIPPPIAGWNTRDPISQMDQTYALELENAYPNSGEIISRGGRTRFSTQGGAILHTFKYGIYNKLLLAAVVTEIYDISTGTASSIRGAAFPLGGFSYSAQFKDRIFLTTNNSADAVYHWTGTGSIAASGFIGPAGADTLLGPVAAYRGRLYFAHLTEPSVWYANYDSTSGALTELPLSLLVRNGGYILFIGTVTRAKDFLEDELLAVVTSEGEILVFEGENPGSVTWNLIGHYFIPLPMGQRAFFYAGSTLMIITRQGLFSMDVVMGGQYSTAIGFTSNGDLSSPIKSDFIAAASNWLTTWGTGFSPLIVSTSWCGVNYPRANLLILNVPSTTDSDTPTSAQYAMNTTTGAWAKFTGWNALSFAVYGDRLYSANNAPVLGTFRDRNNGVFLCDEGETDFGFDNNPIARNIKIRPAYNFFGAPGRVKSFKVAVPHMYQSQGMQLTMDADVDFQNTAATQTVTPDNASTAYKYYAPKVGLAAIGKCASIRIDQSVTTKKFSLQAIEVFYEEGGVLR